MAHQGRQLAFQPGAHGRAKATFLPVQDGFRQKLAERGLEHGLELAVADPDFRGHARGKLDQPVVQERNPAFDRGGHRHLVGQHQEVVGQLSGKIDPHEPVERVALAGDFEGPVEGVDLATPSGREQPLERLRAEDLDVGPVAFLKGLLTGFDEGAGIARQVHQGRMAVAGHVAGKGSDDLPPQPIRKPMVAAAIEIAEISPIAAEQLVAADARQDDRDVAAGEFRDQIGRHEGAVGHGFVHVPEQLGQQFGHLRPHQDLLVLRAEEFGNLPGEGQFVVVGAGLAGVEADGIGLDRPVAVLGHHGDDRA